MARVLKVILWIALILLLLIVLVAVAALSAPVQTTIVQRVITSINQSIEGSISVGSVHVTLAGVIHVKDVTLADPDGSDVLSFDKLSGRVDLWGLPDRRVRIYNLSMDNLRLDMAIDSAGRTNLERAIAPRDSTAPPPDTSAQAEWVIRLDELKIDGGPTYVHNPVDTLIRAEDWTLLADMSFAERKLDYNVEYDSPRQVHILAGGSLVLADTIRDVAGHLQLRVDSTYSGGLYIPAQSVGRLTADVKYQQRADSIAVDASAQSTVLGGLQLRAVMLFPPGVVAGHGELIFDQFRPTTLWQDTTDLNLSGRIVFAKDGSISVVNGWDARVTFADTRYGEYAVQGADLHIVSKDSTATIAGTLDTGHGRLGIHAFADGFDPHHMDVRADFDLDNVNLHQFVAQVPDSLAPLSGTVHIEGQDVSAQNRRLHATAQFAPFTFGRYAVDDLEFAGGVDGNHLRVDTLRLTGLGIGFHVFAEGMLGGEVTYAIRMEASDLRTLEPLLTAMADSLDTLQGAVSLDLEGRVDLQGDSLSGLTAEGDVLLTDARYGSHYVRSADLRLMNFAYPEILFTGAASIDSVVVGEFRVDSMDATVAGNREQFRTEFQLWARADTLFAGAILTASIQSDVTEIALDTLYARVFGYDIWSEMPSVARMEGDRIEVDALAFRSELGVLRASGYMQRVGEQDMAVELSGLQTGRIGELLKTPIPESTTNVRLQFTGTDEDLVGDLFVTIDNILYQGKVVADQIAVQVTATRNVTLLNGRIMTFGDTLGFFGGELPAQISLDSGFVLRRDAQMSGRTKIIEQKLDGFTQFLPSGSHLGGFISADVTFKGSPANPEWLGTFVIRDAIYRDQRTGVDYKNIDISGELVRDTLRFPTFDMTSVGKMSGSGTAVMAFPLPKDLSLNLKLDRFEIMDSPQMRVRATGDLHVSGPLDRLTANGELEFDEVIYRLTAAAMKSVQEVNLDSVLAVLRGDSLAAGEGFSPNDIYRSMALEMRLVIPGNCWIRGSGMNIELEGNLWMYKDYDVDPTINGSIQTRQGDVAFLGRRFEVTEGRIIFEGPIGNPQLDVIAKYEPPSATSSQPVQIRVYGTVTETRFEFIGMSPEEAIAALTGLGQDGEGLLSQEQIRNVATGTATGQLTGMVGKWAGLDVFEYRPGTEPGGNLTGGTLEVGTYVTERLFVRVTQPIETAETGQAVTVEYRLLDWLKLRAQQEAQQNSAFDLLIQFDWR